MEIRSHVKLERMQCVHVIFLICICISMLQVVTYVANVYNRYHKRRKSKDLDISLNSNSSSSDNTEFEMLSSTDLAPLYDAAAR